MFEAVNQFNQEKKNNFKFTQALRHFEEIMMVIKKENDPIEYLKTLKVPFSNTFKSQYSQIAKEKTAADNCCYLIETPEIMAVTCSLGRMIADGMKTNPIFHSKRALKAQILLNLGEMKSFGQFSLYLNDAKSSLQKWVEIYTKQHCAQEVGGKSRLEELAAVKLKEVTVAIIEAAKDATHSLPLPVEANINDWLSQLHRQLSSVLTIDIREIKEVVGAENLTDFNFFTDEIIKGLHKVQESLLKDFESSPLSKMDSWSKQPHDILCAAMLGCCE